jgi:hypothetical protein
MVYTSPETMATPLPYIRYSPDTEYLQIHPGVQSDDYIYDNPKAGESSVKGLALDSSNRFVVKTLPSGAVGDVTGPAGATDNAITRYDGTSGKLVQNSSVLITDGGGITGLTSINGGPIPSTGLGDVIGPASATDNAVARYDSTTGKLIQNSVVIIGDTGDITGVGTINGSSVPSPIGDVRGPASAVANRLASYNGTSGKLIQDSGFTVSGSGSLSGTNTGDVTLAAVGASPNANAATLTGQVLNLQPASASLPGVVTAAAQAFGGTKTISGGVIFNSSPSFGSASVLDNYYAYSYSPVWFEGSGSRGTSQVAAERFGDLIRITLAGIPDNSIQNGGWFQTQTALPVEFRPSSDKLGMVWIVNGSSTRSSPNTVQVGAIYLLSSGNLRIGIDVHSDGVLGSFGSGGTSGDGNGFLQGTVTFSAL